MSNKNIPYALKKGFVTENEFNIIKSLPKFNENETSEGYVYIYTNSTYVNKEHKYKIGRTNNVYRRIIIDPYKYNNASIPGYVKPICCLKCQQYKNIESIIHERIEEKYPNSKIDGQSSEWYEIYLNEALKYFLEYSKCADGNKIICLTDDENMKFLILKLLNNNKKEEENVTEYYVGKNNEVLCKPVDYKKYRNCSFKKDTPLKNNDMVKHFKYQHILFRINIEKNKLIYVSGKDDVFEKGKLYSMTKADNLINGYTTNKNKAGCKAFMTMDGRFINSFYHHSRNDRYLEKYEKNIYTLF